ncbi:amidohydrolase family protein [Mycolicibacterium arenosum]|uniref:Amidohydrolase n=1 Tax=Mycolicibacterium arenosum TaxID=2952157 RepID=A0ABT1M1L0_9MYCO|nr:amidohydrolase family protein [Mycolicibacterium sp. CAU 1645]MCP9273033.1 amidohydrolase [Mycolicibacterium sp. CAU 1645]
MSEARERIDDTARIIDTNVQPHFKHNAEIRKFIDPAYRTRAIPDVEQQWYQAPGGDYRADLHDGRYPGSVPETVARHLFSDGHARCAILNPLTRGNIADYLLNSRICAAINDWLVERWLDSDARFLGTIRVNPEDPRGAVAEIERLAGHPKMVQVGVPMQSREPYGKPQFEPIWEAAAAAGLPVAVHINGGNGVDYAPTFAGHAHTYPGYAAFMPLNFFVHLATLIVEGVFARHPDVRFVFADGGYDILTPLMWRLDTFWLSMRDQTPWVDRHPSEYLTEHVRFCSSALDGPTDPADASRWMEFTGRSDLVMYGSGYPHWSTTAPHDAAAGLDADQRAKLLWHNAATFYKLSDVLEGSDT